MGLKDLPGGHELVSYAASTSCPTARCIYYYNRSIVSQPLTRAFGPIHWSGISINRRGPTMCDPPNSLQTTFWGLVVRMQKPANTYVLMLRYVQHLTGNLLTIMHLCIHVAQLSMQVPKVCVIVLEALSIKASLDRFRSYQDVWQCMSLDLFLKK